MMPRWLWFAALAMNLCAVGYTAWGLTWGGTSTLLSALLFTINVGNSVTLGDLYPVKEQP